MAVAGCAKQRRGSDPLNPAWIYSITAGFSFNATAHGNQQLDVENFLKPSFDALAAGLFCPANQEPRTIRRFDYDDSNFRYLFFHKLPDARIADDEGVGFVVSVKKPTR